MRIILLLVMLSIFPAQGQQRQCATSGAFAAIPPGGKDPVEKSSSSSRTPALARERAGSPPQVPSPVDSKTAGADQEQTRVTPVQIQLHRPNGFQIVLSCSCGTVTYNALTAAANTQEVPILTGIGGNYRFEHVLLQEAEQFRSARIGTLTVSAGRPNTGADLIPAFALKADPSPQNFWYDRPGPLLLSGTYDLVLRFAGTQPLGDGQVSGFSAGTVNWEICGYAVQ